MKVIKKISLLLVIALVAMQFFSPTKNISAGNHTSIFLKETNPSPELKRIFATSCYDCHSNNTTYPWYNNIAPISYWLANHVNEGKEHLNFSEWENYSLDKKDHLLEEIEEEVMNGTMPITDYTFLHSKAKLSKSQINDVVEWAKQTRIIYQLGKQPK
ncbi:heme-binding domain-containing protein [Maribacter hydrothermalis]|uniref:Cytochrome C n=1 Tax=Maribacter hydrothermalis TaxID=1836467 RepID=A0A1B7Z7Q8_9FLAO|nr:heme-binding domain-containing protein [Maribacter hydrothermalis]APQ15863.1 cytochrome C [Maribacter hydrothermalis]OBR38758.1 cytochrome C [Maribacter hydrothermalis]